LIDEPVIGSGARI